MFRVPMYYEQTGHNYNPSNAVFRTAVSENVRLLIDARIQSLPQCRSPAVEIGRIDVFSRTPSTSGRSHRIHLNAPPIVFA